MQATQRPKNLQGARRGRYSSQAPQSGSQGTGPAYCNYIQLFFFYRHIPAVWKQARVTPIFKEGNKQDTSNYRPISVLPLCMKVFERLVHNQFHTHITTNNLLNPHQSGFRPKHSTTTALIDVTDHLYNQSQNGLITGAIFLHLKKAFDTVNPSFSRKS